jgi:hypothetical protein
MYYRRRAELRNRINKWLLESQAPDYEDLHSISDERSSSGDMSVKARTHQCILYHPDFADWESIEGLNSTVYPEKESPSDLFHVLEGAHTIISNLLQGILSPEKSFQQGQSTALSSSLGHIESKTA